MRRASGFMALAVILIGLAGTGIGIGLVTEAQLKSSWIQDQMRAENITLGLSADQVARGDMVDSAAEAQKAADTIRQHRHTNFGTYNQVLGGRSFDPANPTEVTYMQALNLENYLYLAVTGFGVATAVLAIGIFMMIVGIAVALCGLLLFRSSRAKDRIAGAASGQCI